MELQEPLAMTADLLSVVYWAMILACPILGYKCLESFIEHLSLVPALPLWLALAGSIVLSILLDGKITDLRAASPMYEPGRAVFGFIWLYLGAALLVGPLFLLFQGGGGSKD